MILLPPSSYGHFGVYPEFRSLFLQEIYADVLGITLTVTKLKCFFTSCPPLLRAIWGRYFGFIWVCFSMY